MKKKAALIIGINYFNQNAELNGCINDAYKLRDLLVINFGFKVTDVIVMTDDDLGFKSHKPTKLNIIKQIRRLVSKQDEGYTEFWFSYSGHGSYIRDTSGDEIDNNDEVICPVDYSKYKKNRGLITDDKLNHELVSRLGQNSSLYSIMDCCHSGTILDLQYIYRNNNLEKIARTRDIQSNVYKISGSRDDQTSTDIYVRQWQQYGGALTSTFIKTLEETNYQITWRNLIDRIQKNLKTEQFSQIPQLTCSNNNILDDYFINQVVSKPNLDIIFEGDHYSHEETTYNIFSLKLNKFLFKKDKGLSDSKTSRLSINIEPGDYKLVFKDTYGDGGCKSSIVYQGKLLKLVDFSDGKYHIENFTIPSDDPPTTKKITFKVNGDYYCNFDKESRWNIIRSDETYVFDDPVYFNKNNEKQEITLNLEPGIYQLELKDKWGDGGLHGSVETSDKILLEFDFKEGFQKRYNFEV